MATPMDMGETPAIFSNPMAAKTRMLGSMGQLMGGDPRMGQMMGSILPLLMQAKGPGQQRPGMTPTPLPPGATGGP